MRRSDSSVAESKVITLQLFSCVPSTARFTCQSGKAYFVQKLINIMPSCVFRRCTNYTSTVREKKKISFHTLPTDECMKEKWVQIIRTQRREDDWMPTVYTTICSEHFSAEDVYITKKNFQRLKKTAVPVIEKQEDLYLRSDSPNSLEEVDVSDMSSAFDSPTTYALKKRVTRLELEKQKVQKTNKILQQQNKRLMKRVLLIKNILSNTKMKNFNLEQKITDLNIKSEEELENTVELENMEK